MRYVQYAQSSCQFHDFYTMLHSLVRSTHETNATDWQTMEAIHNETSYRDDPTVINNHKYYFP